MVGGIGETVRAEPGRYCVRGPPMNWIQHRLPLDHIPEKGVLACLSLAVTDDGLTTVGAHVTSLTTLDDLMIVATPPITQEDLDERIAEVLAELRGVVSSLLDLPPFP